MPEIQQDRHVDNLREHPTPPHSESALRRGHPGNPSKGNLEARDRHTSAKTCEDAFTRYIAFRLNRLASFNRMLNAIWAEPEYSHEILAIDSDPRTLNHLPSKPNLDPAAPTSSLYKFGQGSATRTPAYNRLERVKAPITTTVNDLALLAAQLKDDFEYRFEKRLNSLRENLFGELDMMKYYTKPSIERRYSKDYRERKWAAGIKGVKLCLDGVSAGFSCVLAAERFHLDLTMPAKSFSRDNIL
ncbi:MAG: hypothetical protein Q9170_004804 [Blastenia crenularia]